ncbi:hypothetical protein OIU85_022636 [Salix viminalis]|uniref:Uncharacterized protein n=1 Tax=Salix viminalis TaxID=40686 RepID=A0A9Q0Z863_SALVM|nr:hypothetical protein OIU85_022636 [Salix viminalis]
MVKGDIDSDDDDFEKVGAHVMDICVLGWVREMDMGVPEAFPSCPQQATGNHKLLNWRKRLWWWRDERWEQELWLSLIDMKGEEDALMTKKMVHGECTIRRKSPVKV